MPLRILLVDDHKIMRAGLRAILAQAEECEVIGEAENGIEAIAFCKQERPDIVVMDVGLPGINGIEAAQVIIGNAPDAKVIMLSMYDDERSVVSAIRAGARAYVLKKASGMDLLAAIAVVAKGGSFMSPQVSDHLLQRIMRIGPSPERLTSTLEDLAPRELQVFRLVACGNASKDIAEILGLGVETVRSYRKTMMRKLSVNNVAGLTQIAITSGIALPNGLVELQRTRTALLASKEATSVLRNFSRKLAAFDAM